jgi:hypothetical protein
MTPEHWQYIERFYHAALEPDTEEQAAEVSLEMSG